jgi:hypothetical protein
MRSGVWFKALSRIDRVLIELTIKVTKTDIRSYSLINRLQYVTSKLEALLENKLSRATRQTGFPLACKLSSIAQSWGNTLAETWGKEAAFAKFLAVLNINTNPCSG